MYFSNVWMLWVFWVYVYLFMFFETGSFRYSTGWSWSHYAVQTELEFTLPLFYLLNAGDCGM